MSLRGNRGGGGGGGGWVEGLTMGPTWMNRKGRAVAAGRRVAWRDREVGNVGIFTDIELLCVCQMKSHFVLYEVYDQRI